MNDSDRSLILPLIALFAMDSGDQILIFSLLFLLI